METQSLDEILRVQRDLHQEDIYKPINTVEVSDSSVFVVEMMDGRNSLKNLIPEINKRKNGN
mgnify:CR=1 FL=1